MQAVTIEVGFIVGGALFTIATSANAVYITTPEYLEAPTLREQIQ